ncbi:MAG TPA: WYL domain-containing protein [Acidimicrobiales bacterium]|nr:WYL domain-containing protein [Acidimicrobiales bacterium]
MATAPPVPTPSNTKLDRLERVTDLVLVLLETQQPLTLDAIAHQVPGYPAEHAARRQAFERDKRLLRDEGIPVLTERLPGNEQYGYRIDRDEFYLPDLALEPDEQVALHLAVAGVHLGDPSGRDALLKLGATGLGDVRPIASIVPTPALIDLFEAVRTKASAAFSYRTGRDRRVAPLGLWFRFGHWYLVAWDLDSSAVRTFRVDRIEGDVTRGEAGSAEGVVPEGEGAVDVEAALPDEPWDTEAANPVEMRILVDALEARRVADQVGEDKVVVRHEDGSIELVVAVSSFVSIRSWVLGLADHATVLEPEVFRDELVAWLTALTETATETETESATEAQTDGGSDGAEKVVAAASDEGRTGAAGSPRSAPGAETSRRLRRLLAVIGWLAQVGEAPIAEVSRRFGMSEQELVAELELAACCGTPPYTPDTLMEIEVSETSVRAFLPKEYGRPRPLTPAEGFAVAASARLLLAVPGSDDDALARALAKLDAALGSHAAVGLDVDAPGYLGAVREATEAGRSVEIDYLSGSRDELTTRVVDPVQVITIDGHWYLDGWCYRAGDMRRFRVDRIIAVRDAPTTGSGSGSGTGSADEVESSGAGGTGTGAPRARPLEEMFVPGPGAVEVHVRLGPSAQWVPESVPVRTVTRDKDGRITDVVLDVAGMAWFERLLLQLGPAARVVRPAELTGLAADAARRVLARYQ